ncbi:MAG: HlyD family efflux transporter periplasmic adaptor subunit [Thermoanaerobaculia bacterium]
MSSASASTPPRLLAASRPEEGAAALAGRYGAAADRPALRKDLVIRRLVQMGETNWVVKNVETNAYYTFGESDWGLIQLFDGTRTRTQIFEVYRAQFPGETIEFSLVLEYEEMLRGMELIAQSVAERNLALLKNFKTARQRAADEKAEGFNIFFLLFHVLDPNRFLDRTVKYIRWLWSPPAVAVSCVVFAWTLGVIVGHWESIWAGTMELYAFLSKPLLDAIEFFLILSCIGCVHEFSHAYVTKMYGGEVHDIGIALLYFTPAFYCDTTDSVLFENKWHSFWVTTAGIYIEAIMCSLATALWVASYPDTFLNAFAYKTMLFTGVSTVFFNINPLIKIDGYYALTSLLEISELREESFRYLGAFFQHHILRLPVEVPAATRRKKRIYWIYGTLALAYIGVIMAFIGGLFYNFYEKYFPNLAIVLLLVTLYRLFRKRVRLAVRTGRLFYLDKKELLMSPRSRPVAVAVAALLALALLVPWTRRTTSAEAILKPARTVRLEAPEDAVVVGVLAHEGDSVRAGQPVLRLASPAAQAEGLELAVERDRLEKEASRGRQRGNASEVFQSEQHQSSVRVALEGDEQRRKRLAVASPIAGRVLTARLEDLAGRYVTTGTLLAEIGDCRTLIAELPVSERLLDDVAIEAPVSALARSRLLSPIKGTVEKVSPATLGQPATARAGQDPGIPPERPDRFIARAAFENSDGALLPGTAVRAKIYSRRVSYASRAWRVLRRWIQTVVW